MKFKYEVPSIKRKQEAIDYINEFYEYNSPINGVGGLYKYLDNYEKWLEKLKDDLMIEATEDRVPSRTFFFIREDDNKIIGMTNIRTKLNQKLTNFGGNIGYSIRPTERGKGYNKINLYLALKVCKECGIKNALLDADKDNPASWRTMESLGAELKEEKNIEKYGLVRFYSINVEKSLEKYKRLYEQYIYKEGNDEEITNRSYGKCRGFKLWK